MEISLAFGKIIGVYLLVVGISLLARRKGWMHVVNEVRKSRSTVKLLAAFELLVGLVIVTYHNIWTFGFEGVITFIGWIMVLEGAAYLFMSHRKVASLIKLFNKPVWYITCGIISVLIGAYFIAVTFQVGL